MAVAGGAGRDLNAFQVQQYHQAFPVHAPETQIQIVCKTFHGAAHQIAVRDIVPDIVIDIVPISGGDGRIVILSEGCAEGGDAQHIFGAAQESLFLAAANQRFQFDAGLFVEDAAALESAELVG